MYTIKHRFRVAFIVGLAGGILLAFLYVNPYSGTITLSEFVLQLSGSRGRFPLGLSFSELISFAMRMIPGYVFEMFIGIELYRHFCTASIYVFSRKPNRIQWYMKEILGVALATIFYQVVFMCSVLLVTVLRYRLEMNDAGFILLFYHFILYTMWMFSVSLVSNLVAIFFGSDTSFLIICGGQAAFIAMLGTAKFFENSVGIVNVWLNMNPIAHLVLGWHTGNTESLSNVLTPPYDGMFFSTSIVLMTIICVLTIVFGSFIISKHDFIIADSEIGGV